MNYNRIEDLRGIFTKLRSIFIAKGNDNLMYFSFDNDQSLDEMPALPFV